MPYYTPSGSFVEDFSGDSDFNDYDAAWGAYDDEEFESYQEYKESGDFLPPEEVEAKTEQFLRSHNVPALNGSCIAFFNAAQEKADSLNISVWEYLGINAPY